MKMVIGILCLLSSLSAGEFETLMGKGTAHWSHLVQREDVLTLDGFKSLYEELPLRLGRPKEGESIPQTVHFIWLGPRPFPPQSVENVRSWIGLHPDWTFKFWTDRPREAPCSSMEVCFVDQFPFSFLRSHFYDSTNWGERSDVLRFEILYREGGVYVDHDASCLHSFEALHAGYDFYCGFELPHPPVAGRSLTMGNGVVGSRPAHPVVKEVIDLMASRWDAVGEKHRGKDGYSKTQLVMERTYLPLTDAAIKLLGKTGHIDVALPAAYFFAKKGVKPLYSEHFFANAWANEEKGAAPFLKDARKGLSKLRHRSRAISAIGRGGLILQFLSCLGLCYFFIKQKRRSNG